MDWEKAGERAIYLLIGFSIAILGFFCCELLDLDDDSCDIGLHRRVAHLENQMAHLNPYNGIN